MPLGHERDTHTYDHSIVSPAPGPAPGPAPALERHDAGRQIFVTVPFLAAVSCASAVDVALALQARRLKCLLSERLRQAGDSNCIVPLLCTFHGVAVQVFAASRRPAGLYGSSPFASTSSSSRSLVQTLLRGTHTTCGPRMRINVEAVSWLGRLSRQRPGESSLSVLATEYSSHITRHRGGGNKTSCLVIRRLLIRPSACGQLNGHSMPWAQFHAAHEFVTSYPSDICSAALVLMWLGGIGNINPLT
ncbi:hypothetical protein BJ170DRAFT_732460 [Xylariales sp. AK1849]|nr:hypothetical protein BJ170DRAFT_732460 [Xylariales sp. AK1849]